MLMSTFTPSLQTIFAQDHDQEVGISEVVKEQTLEKNQERVNEVTSKIDEIIIKFLLLYVDYLLSKVSLPTQSLFSFNPIHF